MVGDSTNLLLLFVVCGSLVAILSINALRLRRRDGRGEIRRDVGGAETPQPASLRSAVMLALLGSGLLLLMPISTVMHAAEPGAANRAEAFVRTLGFLAPLAMCILYWRLSGRSDLK